MAEKKPDGKVRPMTKAAMMQELATMTGLTKKQVADVFEALTGLIHRQLGKKGPGVVTLPGLLKLKRVTRPPRPAREGVDPRTKEKRMYPAKPATTTVRARALKALKEMVQ